MDGRSNFNFRKYMQAKPQTGSLFRNLAYLALLIGVAVAAYQILTRKASVAEHISPTEIRDLQFDIDSSDR